MARVRRQDVTAEVPDPPWCAELPPEEANCYTDGSLKCPAIQTWSMGGFGVWWPRRPIDEQPPTDAEYEVAHIKQIEQGMGMWGGLPGQMASSTRTELAAGIVGALGPGGIRQATDSRSYCLRVNKILSGERLDSKKPWGLQVDGDLWQILDRVLAARGRHSVAVHWIKGHATAEHVEQGKTTLEGMRGNDMADRMASEGARWADQDGAAHLAGHYASKQKAYTDLIHRIHRMILRVLTKERQEREEAAQRQRAMDLAQGKPKQPTIIAPSSYESPPPEQCRSLRLRRPITEGMSDDRATVRCHVWAFLDSTTWRATDAGANGASWVELLALYTSMGGCTHVSQLNAGPLTKPPTFREALAEFSRLTREVLALHAREGDKLLFLPARDKHRRLEHYGVTTHLPCIRAEAGMNGDVRAGVHRSLIALASRGGQPTYQASVEGRLKVVLRKMTMRGPPPWARHPAQSDAVAVAGRTALEEARAATESTRRTDAQGPPRSRPT